MLKHFRPKAGRFGVETNTAGTVVQANITASATTPIYLPVPFRKAVVGRFSITESTAAAGGGAITATLKKYSKSGAADVTLSGAQDITASGITVKENKNVALLSTLTDAQLTVLEGDTLRVDVIAASTVTTQPVNLTFAVELLLQE